MKEEQELHELIEAKIIKRGNELLHLSCIIKRTKEKALELSKEIQRLDNMLKELES